MNIAEIAFYELYPEKQSTRELRVKYSRAFKAYNANVKYTASWMEFKLSHEWKKISDEMKIGLIQSLLAKIFKDNRRTINMDLYDNFIKGVGEYRPATKIDSVLEKSFDRVNEKYFGSFLEKTNLIWGGQSFSKLGTYTYGENTITISKVLADDEELLDYVMYHEMLHKKHKFQVKNRRSRHHTRVFRDDERKFENPDVEKKLGDFLRKKRWLERHPKSAAKKKSSLMDWFFG
jgi:predicted metal-dependent hydrolase